MSKKYTIQELTNTLHNLGWDIEIIPPVIPEPSIKNTKPEITFDDKILFQIQDTMAMANALSESLLNANIQNSEGTFFNQIDDTIFNMFKLHIIQTCNIPKTVSSSDDCLNLIIHLYDNIINHKSTDDELHEIIWDFTQALKRYQWIDVNTQISVINKKRKHILLDL